MNGEEEYKETASCDQITANQKARMKRNCERALQLRNTRMASHPYKMGGKSSSGRLVDSGAGFLIDPAEEDEDVRERLVEEPAPNLTACEGTVCLECRKTYSDSYLNKHFELNVCDGCRNKEKHVLITKTDAKKKYCLKDCDFDVREPVLKFVLRKNPHNDRWGDMKLFLEQHVKKRALEIWESEDKIEEQKEKREENREKMKTKKFEKKIKTLREEVRTSTWHKDLSKHVHAYANEVYHEKEDVYERKCTTCDHSLKYEKM